MYCCYNTTTGIVANSGLCCKTSVCNIKYVKPAAPLPPDTVTIVTDGQAMLSRFIAYAIQYVVIYVLFTMTETVIVQFVDAIKKKTIFGILIFLGWIFLLLGTIIQLPFIVLRQTSTNVHFKDWCLRYEFVAHCV